MQVTINLFDPSAFAVNFSAYDREAVQLVKDISRRGGGGPYDPATKTWFVPNTAHHVEQLKTRFPEALWETRAKAAVKAMPRRIFEEDIDISEFPDWVVPAKEKLEDYQKIGVLFCLKNRRTLLADCVGGGKTVQSILAVEAARATSVLVVVPKSLIPKWVRELRRWAGRNAMSIDADNIDDFAKLTVAEFKKEIERAKYLITNYETLPRNKAPILLQWKWDAVIGDEIHRIKGAKSQRSKAFTRIKANTAILVSATPMLNKPIELYPLLNYATEGGMGSFDNYGSQFCGAGYKLIPQHALCRACGQIREGLKAPCQHCGKADSGEMQFLKVKSYDGKSNMDELKEKLRGVMIGRPESEILAHIPPKRRIWRTIKMAPEFQRQYDACIADLRNYLLVHKKKSLESAERSCRAEALVKFGQGREILSLAKVAPMVDEIRQAVARGERAVVFTEHIPTVYAVREALLPSKDEATIPVFIISGPTEAHQREIAQKSFEQTPGSVMVCTGRTGGEGLDMYWCTHSFHADLPWSPKLLEQYEGRLRRKGQTRGTFFFRYICEDTYDERVMAILKEKEEANSELLDSEDVIGEVLIREMLQEARAGDESDPKEPAA